MIELPPHYLLGISYSIVGMLAVDTQRRQPRSVDQRVNRTEIKSPAPVDGAGPEDRCGPLIITNGGANPSRPNGGPIPIGGRDHNPIRVPKNTRKDTIPSHASPIATARSLSAFPPPSCSNLFLVAPLRELFLPSCTNETPLSIYGALAFGYSHIFGDSGKSAMGATGISGIRGTGPAGCWRPPIWSLPSATTQSNIHRLCGMGATPGSSSTSMFCRRTWTTPIARLSSYRAILLRRSSCWRRS